MIIKARQLRKSFVRRGRGTVEAVAGVDLDVEQGEIFGLLGPNGAGKTTTMRILATLLDADGGEATVAGLDLRRDGPAVRQVLGYVGQSGGLYHTMSARQEIELQARLFGAGRAAARRRTAELIEIFALGECCDRASRTLSGGQRRRIEIALGLVHTPRVLLLDEPSTGLDPQSRAELWNEIRALRDAGTTVVLTTHYLDEADELCDRIVIVDNGRVVATGTPVELKREIGGDVVDLALLAPDDRAHRVLSDEPGIHQVEAVPTGLRLTVTDGASVLPRVLRVLDEQQVQVGSVTVHGPGLDDVFLARTGRPMRTTQRAALSTRSHR